VPELLNIAMNTVLIILILAVIAPEPEARPKLAGPVASAEMPVF
jgi:hypothetical protein